MRREELVAPLLAEGAKIGKRVADAKGNAAILLAFDGVAGESTMALASCLAPGGKIIAYSGMSGQPAQLSPLHVIFRRISLQGFWLNEPHWKSDPLFRESIKEAAMHVAHGRLTVPIAGEYALADAKAAVAHAVRGGKVLFKRT